MAPILEWLNDYSAGVTLLIVLGAALVYLMKLVTDNAVRTQFTRYSKRLELMMKNRADFEQKLLLDQYELVSRLADKLGHITTDLNRHRSGTEVEGLFVDGDIVPLTEVYEELAFRRYLLKSTFRKILTDLADNVLAIANAHGDAELKRLGVAYQEQLQQFHQAMNDEFGIDDVKGRRDLDA